MAKLFERKTNTPTSLNCLITRATITFLEVKGLKLHFQFYSCLFLKQLYWYIRLDFHWVKSKTLLYLQVEVQDNEIRFLQKVYPFKFQIFVQTKRQSIFIYQIEISCKQIKICFVWNLNFGNNFFPCFVFYPIRVCHLIMLFRVFLFMKTIRVLLLSSLSQSQ